MRFFYSPAARGFFIDAMNLALPLDAVEVTEADYRALLDGQAAGRPIQAGPDGKPQLAAAPTPASSWYVPVALLRQRLEAAGKWAAAAAAIAVDPATMLKLVTLQQGVANDDAQALALLRGIGADPAVILARPGA
jgi:hypothetical protein